MLLLITLLKKKDVMFVLRPCLSRSSNDANCNSIDNVSIVSRVNDGQLSSHQRTMSWADRFVHFNLMPSGKNGSHIFTTQTRIIRSRCCQHVQIKT